MKEKFVMTSFLAAGVTDVASTVVGLNLPGFHETGIYANHVAELNMTEAYVFRMAVTAVLIGAYALTKTYENKFTFSVDKAMRIANIYAWGIVALNTVQLAAYFR